MRAFATLCLAAAGLAVLSLAGVTAHRLLRSDVEAAVYRARLEELGRDYEALRTRYDEAVRRTAVTELEVEGERLWVVVRDATGARRRIETPYDPRREIYVDFALLDGRLWMRRVFDASTPPEQGLLIDPGLAAVDWSRHPQAFGKATYRSLEPGRWVLSVSGDGALGLARSEDDAPVHLEPAPAIRRYAPVEQSVASRLEAIRPGEALRALAARLSARD